MGIGKRIKEARNALNMTQEELAKKLGVTKGAMQIMKMKPVTLKSLLCINYLKHSMLMLTTFFKML